MKTAIIYSSATGNTRQLAEALAARLGVPAVRLADADGSWQQADRILAGFWTDKGSCDEKMAAFLAGLHGKEVALFGTAGFGKDNAYFDGILGRVRAHLPEDCRYLDGFMCPGKMGPAIRRRYETMLEQNPGDARAAMLLENFDAVSSRPDQQDLEALCQWAERL